MLGYLRRSRWVKGLATVIFSGISISTNFLLSGHLITAFVLTCFSIAVGVFFFWEDLKRLKIVYPKNTGIVESPAWLYLFALLGIGCLALSGIRVYMATQNMPRALTADDFAQPYVRGKYVKIEDYADPQSVIEGRTFEDSWIYGPAVLYLMGTSHLDQNHFTGAPGGLFFTLPVGSQVGESTGVIIVKESTFKRCHFRNVSFVGPQELTDRFNRELHDEGHAP